MVKDAKNLKVFKVYIKDKRFVLYLIKEELITNKECIKEGSKLKKDEYFLKIFYVQAEKIIKNHILTSTNVPSQYYGSKINKEHKIYKRINTIKKYQIEWKYNVLKEKERQNL